MAALTHRQISPHLYEWSAYSHSVKTVLTSHAFVHDGKVVLIDPIAADAPVAVAVHKLGRPVLIIATNANHNRDISRWKTLLDIPVAASALAVKDLGFKPDVILESAKLLHGLSPIALEGAAPGEHALFSAETKLLVVGDALIHLEGKGLTVLPDKYASHPQALKKSLQTLLRLKFDTLAFAHGDAIVGGANAQVRTALGL
jgi:glyoxylase-like metal-dependent hydrolase (beta-lactamase superfamily II)